VKTVIDKDKLVEYAEKAAEEVEKGWCQGDLADSEGNVCAMGALQAALFSREEVPYVSPLAVDEAKLAYFTTLRDTAIDMIRRVKIAKCLLSFGIPYWNDEPGRTKAEVADMWRMVAKEIANNEEVV
jgi:hypothetical protein